MSAHKRNQDGRLADQTKFERSKTYHQKSTITQPEGQRHLPRQYIVPSHGETRNYATYAANSYSSAIAITDILGQREL